MIHTLNDPKENAMGNLPLEKAGVEILVDKATGLDVSGKVFSLKSGQTITFEKLILATAPDRHPGVLPGANLLTVKLIFAKRAGTLLGGQVSGGLSVGELINAIAIGIQMKLNVRELDL